jgi:hypothetical protein
VRFPVRLKLLAFLLTGVALLTSTQSDAAGSRLFSVRQPVYAVVSGVLFAGEAVGYWGRKGTVAVQSTLDDTQHCSGSFRFTGSRVGVATIDCSDGSNLEFAFDALGTFSGWGQGATPLGPARFTFGLSPEKATPYLDLPKGKRIVVSTQGPKLQDD